MECDYIITIHFCQKKKKGDYQVHDYKGGLL